MTMAFAFFAAVSHRLLHEDVLCGLTEWFVHGVPWLLLNRVSKELEKLVNQVRLQNGSFCIF